MSASWCGSMRGPRVKTPLLLLLLLLLLTTLIGTVFCQYEDDGTDSEGGAAKEKQTGDPNPVEDGGTETSESPTSNPDPTPAADAPPAEDVLSQSTSAFPPPDENIEADQGSGLSTEVVATAGQSSSLQTTSTPTEEGLSPIIILIPVVLVVVIIGMIVCGIFINRRWNKKARNQELRKEDPYLEGSSTEKVPMPMFEEDVPSVLELEMEELDQWMKKGGETPEDSKHA